MIGEETKKKVLSELEKFGNVFYACIKNGVSTSTYYRWFENNKDFKKRARIAIKVGQKNFVDLAENGLISNVGNKDQRAIEYVLSHLSKRYRKSDESKVIIVHRKDNDSYAPIKKITLEDLLQENDLKVEKEQAEWDAKAKLVWDELKKNGEIPIKPNGESIGFEEVYKFKVYIEEYQKKAKENQSQEGLKVLDGNTDNNADNESKDLK
jgi:hypothetical protein